ncbi:hypothetical protein HMPREF1575_01345 [Gardnerella vaginalis JCP7672]|nr:hypothetical protein HMPREF1575_01345 [Gardnerella vaginalis JCP7672]
MLVGFISQQALPGVQNTALQAKSAQSSYVNKRKPTRNYR